jgi:hypothetical protein
LSQCGKIKKKMIGRHVQAFLHHKGDEFDSNLESSIYKVVQPHFNKTDVSFLTLKN